MPRFVILEHDWPALHWDFLLEAGTVLRSWRLLSEPLPGTESPTEPNTPHRLLYLDYEGPLSANRGSVRRWDAGTFEWIVDEPNRIVVKLQGKILTGECSIEGSRCRLPENAPMT